MFLADVSDYLRRSFLKWEARLGEAYKIECQHTASSWWKWSQYICPGAIFSSHASDKHSKCVTVIQWTEMGKRKQNCKKVKQEFVEGYPLNLDTEIRKATVATEQTPSVNFGAKTLSQRKGWVGNSYSAGGFALLQMQKLIWHFSPHRPILKYPFSKTGIISIVSFFFKK